MSNILSIVHDFRSRGFACSVFLLLAFTSHAQETWEKEREGEIKDLEIEITKERQLTLPRANRFFQKIPPRAYEPIVPAITYEVKPFSYSASNFVPVIRPLRIRQEELAKLYGNYVSGGIGNYTSFMVEGNVATKRDKKKMLGADFYWRSFGKGPVDGDHSASSTTRFTLYGKTVTDAATLSGDLGYQNQRGYFYNYVSTTEVNRDKLKQVYERFGVNLTVENTKRGDFNYRLQTGYSHLRDAYVSTEGEFSVLFKGERALKGGNRIRLNADVFLINRKDSLYAQSRNLVRIQPAYEFNPMEKLTVTVGVNLAFTNEPGVEGGSMKVYPHVQGRYAASDRTFFYATLTGNMDKVNLHTLSAENTWLNSNNLMLHTNRVVELDGGLQTALGKKLSARVGASYASLKNLYFYQAVRDEFDLSGTPTGIDFQKFDLVYDKTTGRINPYAQINFAQSDVLDISLRMDYFNYQVDVVSYAWHRPTYRTDLRVQYTLFKKIYLQAGFITQGGMKAMEPGTGLIRTLDTAADLNFKARYFFSKQLSGFVQMDNLLSNQYPIYLGYPARGFQALVGVSWSL